MKLLKLQITHKPKKTDLFNIIFHISKKGTERFKMQLTNKGKLELLMFDIGVGMRLLESKSIYIEQDYKEHRIEEFLQEEIITLGLPTEMEYENIYFLRTDISNWRNDMLYTEPGTDSGVEEKTLNYLYNCFIKRPLTKVGRQEADTRETTLVSNSDLEKFSAAYKSHIEWLKQKYSKIKVHHS